MEKLHSKLSLVSLWAKHLKLFFILVQELFYYIWDKFYYGNQLEIEDERDITGAVVIVTGANSGIGKEAVYQFAIRKAKVILACRNAVSNNSAIEDIRKRAREDGISFDLDLIPMHLDLTDFGSIRKFSEDIKRNHERVDILVNNAGIFDTSGIHHVNKSGVEEHISVNYLSHFLLTQLLLQTFMPLSNAINGIPSIVINVSSSLQSFGIFADELNLLLGQRPQTMGILNSLPYGLSKYYAALTAKEFSLRINPERVLFYSMCPGYVDTSIFRSFAWWLKDIAKMMAMITAVDLKRSADTILYLALSKNSQVNGNFYRFRSHHKYIQKRIDENTLLRLKLWNESMESIGLAVAS